MCKAWSLSTWRCNANFFYGCKVVCTWPTARAGQARSCSPAGRHTECRHRALCATRGLRRRAARAPRARARRRARRRARPPRRPPGTRTAAGRRPPPAAPPMRCAPPPRPPAHDMCQSARMQPQGPACKAVCVAMGCYILCHILCRTGLGVAGPSGLVTHPVAAPVRCMTTCMQKQGALASAARRASAAASAGPLASARRPSAAESPLATPPRCPRCARRASCAAAAARSAARRAARTSSHSACEREGGRPRQKWKLVGSKLAVPAPSLILVLIAIPSFALLYSMDELVDPAITVKVRRMVGT
jgi:hypothetical protein